MFPRILFVLRLGVLLGVFSFLTACQKAKPLAAETAPPPPPSAPAPAETPSEPDQAQHLRTVDLHIDSAILHTQIAGTESQREIGLMHVAHMGDNDGMIFLMPAPERVSFWMKDTLIPLSIAFIDPNGTVLEIHDMKAMDLTTLNSDSNEVAYALETNLHWFALNGIKPGDHLVPAPVTLGTPEP